MNDSTIREKTGHTLPALQSVQGSFTSLDLAIVYLESHPGSPAGETTVDQAQLVRKIDRHIVPIALAAFTLQFLDKFDINVNSQYAAVMGLNQDLKLIGNDFNNAASAMYIANLIAELPTGALCITILLSKVDDVSGYIVQKVRPGKWLGFNMILWGVVTACMAAVNNYRGLVATRIMIGILEAATAPCLMLITGMWYTKSEAVIRFAIWYCGLGIAQMLGSLLSWGFQKVHHEALSGWRNMFLVLGCVTAATGIWALCSMPDSPMEASWLTEAEKRVAIQRVSVNQTGIKNTHFKWQHLRELVLDLQIWLMTCLIIVTSLTSGVISFYSTTLIRNFGFSPQRSALLNMPSGAVSLLSCLATAYIAHRYNARALSMTVFCCLAAMGSGLMSFLPSNQRAGLLAGVYLVNMETVTLFLVFCLTTANVAGQTKRVAANALISGAFSVGNIIGPQLFKPKDAPQYIPAKIILLVTEIATALFAAALRVYYGWQNSVRDKAFQEELNQSREAKPDNLEWRNLTDRENETFRYKY
ncbi:MFS domain-containing protein [Mycena indigotica]|uniref:MFS domain-containing protein n=1 Tax=Mycena indigotica TaxID=2126181 RepID=A0A8H6VYR3_9AGAR|nr:MFS domain-containing protein [Mycena indigotica]KAF7293049.1 MFS domain-containing protein [Mycena indigotica]